MKDEDHWEEEIKEDYGMNEWMNEGERIRRVIIKEEVIKEQEEGRTRRRDERSRRNEWEMMMKMQGKNMKV